MSGALRRNAARRSAVSPPSTAPCQTNWSRAHPIAWATGCWASRSITLIVFLLAEAVPSPVHRLARGLRQAIRRLPVVEQTTNLAQFLGRRPARRERLHHALGRRAAEGAVEEVADQLALRLRLGHPRLKHV